MECKGNAGNLSRGHQNTHKILKLNKRADTKYDNQARFDGQRFGKLKVATLNVRGTAEKTGELHKYNYLGNMTSCEGELDIDNKLHNN